MVFRSQLRVYGMTRRERDPLAVLQLDADGINSLNANVRHEGDGAA